MLHLQAFLRDKKVCSVAATTPYGVAKILRRIRFDSAKVIVEYGPGDGAFTGKLLRRMRPDASLIVVETNDLFVSKLRKKFHDPRLSIVHDSAENIAEILAARGCESMDCVISGIPFSQIKLSVKRKIMGETSRLLTRDGTFLVYQALTAPRGRLFTKKNLARTFHLASETFILPNIPPLYVIEAVPMPHASGSPQSREG